MAEIAVAGALAVLKQTTVIVGDLVTKEGSRLSRLQEEIGWIETEMDHIRSYLKNAEDKQGEDTDVATLVTDIRNLAFDVEDIMETYFPHLVTEASKKKEGRFHKFLKFVPRIFCFGYNAHNFLVETQAIRRRVEDINRLRITYGITERNDPTVERDRWDERRSYPHLDEPNVVGFDEDINNLVARIKSGDSQLHVISIIGMGGAGKTTLAKKVYKSVRGSFDHSPWVYVSQQPNIEDRLKDIAKQVGLEIPNWENGQHMPILFSHLSEHRFVLFLDDIWETQTWDALKNAIPTSSTNGSRIILTSRRTDVGVHVGGRESLFPLHGLSEQDSKQLFKIVMGSEETTNDPPQLENIGEKILRQCGKLPLAIVVAAGLLRLKERSESAWNGVLEEMIRSQGDASKICALSYKELPANLKPCFLYFGLFKEDQEIQAFELINLWAAEGFIKSSEVREVEDVGDDYLNGLIARNLVQVVKRSVNGRVQSCRIHDVLLMYCIRVAKEINFFYTCKDVTSANGSRARRVTVDSLLLEDYISSGHQTPKLRTMISFESKDAQKIGKENEYLRNLSLLRVLNVFLFPPEYILNEAWNFRHLTYLKLESGGYLREAEKVLTIPHAISNLKRLVTLDVRMVVYRRGSFFVSVDIVIPMVIWNMEQLRHVLLPSIPYMATRIQGKDDKFNSERISVQNLQTLTGINPDIFEANWLNNLSNVRTLEIDLVSQHMVEILSQSSLSYKLEKLELFARDISVRMLNLSRFHNLFSMTLNNVFIRTWELPPNLLELNLMGTRLDEDAMEILKKLPKLRILFLGLFAYIGEVIVVTGESNDFSLLEELSLQSYPSNLGEIIIEEGGMPKLKKFRTSNINRDKLAIPKRIEKIMNLR